MGGKSKLRAEIISLMPRHQTYIELFGGAGWVLFAKPSSQIEVFNDIDRGLINLYMAIRDNVQLFYETLKQYPISQDLFKEISERYTNSGHGENIKDVNVLLACDTYYLIMNSFNGMMASPSFSMSKARKSNYSKFFKTDWPVISERLKEVVITAEDFSTIIKKYDDKNSFFYIDAPYTMATDNQHYYHKSFSENDHQRLAEQLSSISGKFLMSYDISPLILNLYSDFNIINCKCSQNEMFILNYEVPDTPYFSCSIGIPLQPGKHQRTGTWTIPNCPYCGSRDVQQASKRVTLDNKRRSWHPCNYICNSCNEPYKMLQAD